jgi:uncharacterized membrane protein
MERHQVCIFFRPLNIVFKMFSDFLKGLYGSSCFSLAFVFQLIFAWKYGKSGNSHLYSHPLKLNCTH